MDVPEGKERSDAVITFRSVSGEKWLRSRRDSRLCRAHVAKRSVTVYIMPFVVFASEKGVTGAKHEQPPINSALAPVEKEGKSGHFFVVIFNSVEMQLANPHKMALFL